MTWRSWVWPVIWAVGLIALGAVLASIPDNWSRFIRTFNGFVIVAILVWVVRRIFGYESALVDHRTEIIDLMKGAEAARQREIFELADRTSQIAKELADRQAAALATASEHVSVRADSIEEKVDTVVQAVTTNGTKETP